MLPPDMDPQNPVSRTSDLIYDASRLCTRALNATPNGIDRLDALLARGLLGGNESDVPYMGRASALVFGWGGPRLLLPDTVLDILNRTERVWRERQDATSDADALTPILLRLTASTGGRQSPKRLAGSGTGLFCRLRIALATLARIGLRRGRPPVRAAAQGAIYLNASHFPLDWPTHISWLAQRPDVKPVVMIHDLLPLDHPEWFWTGEAARHQARLAFLAERGVGAIVTSVAVEERLQAEMARAGRRDLSVLRAPPPVSPTFHTPQRSDPRLASALYFVVCGTLEPRKNHAVLIRVWRLLAAERSRVTPKLIVVGKRGWLYGHLLAEMLHLARAGHLVLVSGLPSGAYCLLLDSSLGLLAPSLDEGYGLPVAEALARGVPVVASDIPPFREQGADLLIDPNDETKWYDAVVALAAAGPQVAARAAAPFRARNEGDYLGAVRSFLNALA